MGMWEVFVSNDKAVKRNHLHLGLMFDAPAHFQNVKFLCHDVFVFLQRSDDSCTNAEAPGDHR